MKTCMLALAVLASLCATPAMARESTAATAPAQEQAKPQESQVAEADEERLICERVKSTGSHKVERVCKTAKQRAEERESAKTRAGQQATDRMMQTRSICASPQCAGQ